MPRSLTATAATAATAATLLAAAMLTSCSAPAESTASPTPSIPAADGVDGGGAEEVAAPASALLVADERGAITILDLDADDRESIDGDGDVLGEGRFAYRTHESDGEARVEIIDSGRWTVPHGDHSHSFLGAAGPVETVEGAGSPRVTIGDHATAVLFSDGLALVDHETVGDEEPARIPLATTAEFVVPFAGHLLAATGSTVDVLDATGSPTGAGSACVDPFDVDITRVGAVIACADGAVLVTREVGGMLVAEAIPYTEGAPAPSALRGRADRPDLAGVAGDGGAWLLDSRARTWTLLPTDAPLVAAAALGDDDGRTVVVADDGTIRVLGADGSELARTAPLVSASLADPDARARITLLVDAEHAYVSDPASGTIHEIDHRDDAVVTRAFTGLDPWHVQLVG